MRLRSIHECIKKLGALFCVRIKAGPLEGKKWIVSTGLRFTQGNYEPQKTAAVEKAVGDGDVVYDIGAHAGYFSLIMALKAGSEGHVYSFEPRPLNYSFLERHIRLNQFQNVSIFPLCVGADEGDVRFNDDTGTGTGHVAEDGKTGGENGVDR